MTAGAQRARRVLVVGSLNMDLVIHTDRLPRLGETLHGSGFAANPGGKGANQALAAARLGAQVRLLGGVGDDAHGHTLLRTLQADGVDTTGVQVFPDTPTGVAVITVCGGDNHILLDAGANARLTPAWIAAQRAAFAWADVVALQLEIPLETVAAAAALARQEGAAVVLNPAPAQPLPDTLLAQVDLLVPNEHEAALLLAGDGAAAAPLATPEQALTAAAALCARGPRWVAITLGGQGCVLCGGGHAAAPGAQVPAYAVQAVDTTAAGDCFIGGLCAAWPSAAGCATAQPATAFADALTLATAAAAIAVTRPGAAPSLPTRAEVQAFVAARQSAQTDSRPS